MFEDHTPIPIGKFKGLFGRNQISDDAENGYFINSLNTISIGGDVKTRHGFNKTITFGAIRRMHIWKVEGEADRTLLLNTNGQLFDTTASLSTPIKDFGSLTTDFCIIPMYGRLYISPHNGETGESGEYVYVYTGSGLARPAAGLKPSGGSSAVVSATAGDIEEGTHLFGWCYETDTGFVTPPCDSDDFNILEFDGTKAVDFSSIPTGPAGTAARRLIATRAIQDFNGDREGYEFFFVPGGRIADNSTTVLNSVSFFDAELITSADYTFDNLELIPACLWMSPYGNRIMYGGENANPSMTRVSKSTEPESVNSLSGFVIADPHEEEGVKNGLEFRNAFYIFKGNPGHTYMTSDNGYEPSTWNCPAIDKGIGGDTYSVSQYLDSKGANADFFLTADPAGIFRFDGSYNEQVPLTYGIQTKIWNRINKDSFHKIQLQLDSKRFLIYASLPLDESEEISHILVGDYSDGLWWDKIKWHLWNSAEFEIASIAIRINNSTKRTELLTAGITGNVYVYDEDTYDDESLAIDCYIQFALLNLEDHYVHHFAGVRFDITGSGTLTIKAYKKDLTSFVAVGSLALVANPSVDYTKTFNLENEKCSVKIEINSATRYFVLSNMTVYAQAIWETRPA